MLPRIFIPICDDNLWLLKPLSYLFDKYWRKETKIVIFQLCKNNGANKGKKINIQYDVGDNDFYWLNVDNKKTFFVFPEQLLIDRGIIGNTKTTKFFKVTLKLNNVFILSYLFYILRKANNLYSKLSNF